MEIRDYVSHVGWRLWILLLLPIVSGGVAFGLLADTPPQYEAKSVLTVPSSVVGGVSSGSVAQYMANFEQAIVSDQVVARTADEVGVAGREVRDGLNTRQLGSSNLVRVSYQGPDPGKAARIVEVATRWAFDLVEQIQLPFGQSLYVIRSRVSTTTSDLQVAETRLQHFLLRSGLVFPREQYLLAASDVARLESEILHAKTVGSSTVDLEAALSDRRREVKLLGAKIPRYQQLQSVVDRAVVDVDAARDELRLAEDQLAHLKPQMTHVSTKRLARMRTIGRGVGVAAGGGLIVVMALVLLFPSRPAPAWPGVSDPRRNSAPMPSPSSTGMTRRTSSDRM
jgi:uncharacterized protein involved in exopolysaccharide biosynthesis